MRYVLKSHSPTLDEVKNGIKSQDYVSIAFSSRDEVEMAIAQLQLALDAEPIAGRYYCLGAAGELVTEESFDAELEVLLPDSVTA